MFSTFRNTVEALAQGVERPKTPEQSGRSQSPARRSNDVFASPSSLAESALSNLKKSLGTSHTNAHSPPPRPSSSQSNRRIASLSLEDRLRASFTVGEASRATTPGTPAALGDGSGTSTPSQSQEVDPMSVALPMSPDSDAGRATHPAPVPPAISTASPPPPVSASDEPPLTASFVGVRSLVSNEDHPLSPGPSASPVPPLSPRPSQPAATSPAPGAAASSPPAHAPVPAEQPVEESPAAAPSATEDVAQAPQPDEAPVPPTKDATEPGTPDVPTLEKPPEDAVAPSSPEEADIVAEPAPQLPHASSSDVVEEAPTTTTIPASVEESIPVTTPADEPIASDLLPPSSKDEEVDVEKLQARLKLVEQRFTDVSTSFKRLQAEKRAADAVLGDLTPVESISDTDGLRNHLRNLSLKLDLSMEEIKRLNAQHQTQELRIEELRDTHRLESASQVELVDQLRAQLDAANAKLAAATSAAAADTSSQQAAFAQLTAELSKAKTLAKEEEEKRTKAISLLKTVRTKLVKAEKDKDDKEKEVAKEREDRERVIADMKKVEADVERGRSEREREVRALREQFEKEIANATHNQELSAKNSQIATLENSVRSLSAEKASLFDQLQLRQGELESAQSHLETLQSQTGELQYQLREANDRVALLQDELSTQPMSAGGNGANGSVPSEDVARFLREAEGKYEARLSDLRERMRALEKERNDAEEEWSRNLADRSREVERLRRIVGEKDGEYDESVRGMREREKKIGELEALNASLRQEMDD
ncbi:hypothetical protein EXIGLDRAFT_761447, partial [Exidia glandulosa HHB12029]